MTKELVQTWLDSGQLAQLETAVLKGKVLKTETSFLECFVLPFQIIILT